MAEHIAEIIQITIGAIAGVRVSLRTSLNAISFMDPDTQSEALEILSFEVGCASAVMFFIFL